VRTVELYEVASTYYQTYSLLESDHGVARGFSGTRTWAVEVPIENHNAYAYTGPGDVGGLSGLGSRVTVSAVDDYYGVHAWELEVLDGETTFTDSTLTGAYTWEHQFGATRLVLAVGQARSVSSTARQYLPVTSDATVGALLGRICDWRSSEDSVFALEVVTPDADLAETDTPTLLPAQLTKYLRFYVLSRAFGRPGEGRQPILSDFYGRRFKRGVDLFRAFGDVARADRTYQREAAVPSDAGRPAYVRLPSTFPSVWR
jgi:hypothetical protein